MKKIITALLFFGTIGANAQENNFILEGKVGALQAPAKAYLVYNRNSTSPITDSVSLSQGKFRFTGFINGTEKAYLVVSHDGRGIGSRDMLEIYLEQGLLLLPETDSVSNVIVHDSPVNADNQQLVKALKPINNQIRTITATIRSAQGLDATQAIAKRNALADEKKRILLAFIKDHPESIVSLDALQQYAGSVPELEVVEPLFNSLSPEVRNSYTGLLYDSQLDKIKRTDIGQPAPLFTQPDSEGKPVNLADFRGQYVLIDFWASWCKPCRAENPNVVKAYEKYKDKGFTVLGVSLDSQKARTAWLKAIEDDGLTWTNVADLNGWNNEAAVSYGIRAIPQNFLVNQQGVIVAKNIRGEHLSAKLSELLD